MKFSAIFTLGLAGTALANPLVARAGPTDIISDISSKTDALDSAIKGYSGGDTKKIEDASADLVSTITKGTDTIKGGPDLSTSDALGLTEPVQALTKKVQQTVDDLIAKKDEVVKAGAGGKVKESLNAQKSAADGLASAISGKVPESLKDIAKQLSAGISNAIQKGIDSYKDVSDGGSSATPSASATGTASATKTGGATATGTSTRVIPTSSGAASSSSVPSGSATATRSGSSSATSPPLHTGAANKATIGYSLGAVAMAAIAVAV